MQSNYTLSDDPLSLDNIRSVLIRLEETIIFGLIERAQFAHNPRIYIRGAFPELEVSYPEPEKGKEKEVYSGSWLEWFLHETECFHCQFSYLSNTPDTRLTIIPTV
jgi:chorismate mutase